MKPKNILIMESDVIGLELFFQFFQDKFQIFTAKNRKNIFKILKEIHIDLFVLSQQIKDDDGALILKKIKKNYPQIKRVCLFLEENSKKPFHYKEDDLVHAWIKKPWDPKDIQQKLEDLLAGLYFNEEFDSFNKMVNHLLEVLEDCKLKSLFQPITQFEPLNVYGHELFTHGPSSLGLEDPRKLINLAHRSGLMVEFEKAARENAIRAIENNNIPKQIFLNNCPSVILSSEFENLLIYDHLGIKPKNVVIEITECDHLDNIKDFIPRINYYRSRGFKISVDDVGRGNSSLYLMTESKPDFAKLDECMVRGISKNATKRAFVTNLVDYAKKYGIQIVAEGIETQEEFETLKSLGINMGQGYYFSKPKPIIHEIINVP